jgi:hypothetical protein
MITTGALSANIITTGTMSANRVRAGIITDNSGNNYWNLTNSTLRMTNGSIDVGNFHVDSSGVLTCVGADISGELHTSDTQGKYYIDIANGEIRTGKYESGEKIETGIVSFVETQYSATQSVPGILIQSDEIYVTAEQYRMILSAESDIWIRSTSGDMYIEAGGDLCEIVAREFDPVIITSSGYRTGLSFTGTRRFITNIQSQSGGGITWTWNDYSFIHGMMMD